MRISNNNTKAKESWCPRKLVQPCVCLDATNWRPGAPSFLACIDPPSPRSSMNRANLAAFSRTNFSSNNLGRILPSNALYRDGVGTRVRGMVSPELKNGQIPGSADCFYSYVRAIYMQTRHNFCVFRASASDVKCREDRRLVDLGQGKRFISQTS
jgi:hypothetical protein